MNGVDWSDPETWRFINTFAPWLSALGTLAAVIVSLYIATAQNRLKVRVAAARTRLVAMGQSFGEGEPVVSVDVTNLSRRPVKVIGIYWRGRWQRRGRFVQIPSDHPLSAQLPLELPPDGGNGTFIFPEKGYREAHHRKFLRALFGGTLAPLKSKVIRVGVSTTMGQRFEGKPDAGLTNWLRELAQTAKVRTHPASEDSDRDSA